MYYEDNFTILYLIIITFRRLTAHAYLIYRTFDSSFAINANCFGVERM